MIPASVDGVQSCAGRIWHHLLSGVVMPWIVLAVSGVRICGQVTLKNFGKDLPKEALADAVQMLLMKTIIMDIYGKEEADALTQRMHDDPDGVGGIAWVTEVLSRMLAADMRGEKTSLEMVLEEISNG